MHHKTFQGKHCDYCDGLSSLHSFLSTYESLIMLEKPSREKFYTKRAKKARKHEQERRVNAENKRREYAQLPAVKENDYAA